MSVDNENNQALMRELDELRARIPRLEALAVEHEKARHLQTALFRIADITAAESDMATFYRELHAVIDELMYAKNFAIALYDEKSDTVSFAYFVDTVDTLDMTSLAHIPADELKYSLTGYVLRTGKPLHVDAQGIIDLDRQGHTRSLGAECVDWLGIPLNAGDKTLGVLMIQSYVEDIVYTSEDENLLVFVSQHIATALQRKQADEALLRAHDELEQRVRERTAELEKSNVVLEQEIAERERAERLQRALFRIADLTSSNVPLPEFYRAIHGIVAELMYADNFYIAIYDSDAETLNFPYFVDHYDQAPPIKNLKVTGTSLTGRVLTSGKPLLLTRENRETMLAHQPAVGTRSSTWLGIPLQDRDTSIGVLVIQSYDEHIQFSERDQELLTFVSQHIATALRRRRDAEELRDTHDKLREAHDELEQKVIARTQELSAANEELQQEIAERRRIEQKLTHDAFHDALTELPNRALFIDRLERALLHRDRNPEASFAVLYLDLDRFKVVNDSLGHLFGDRLLVEVSQRLMTCTRLGDTVARLGGDEFSLLLEGATSHQDAISVAERILHKLTECFILDEHQVFVSTSIGITLSSFAYTRAEDVLRDADTAMYHAKARGKARFEVFNPQLHNQAINRLRLENDLRRALENDEILPYFQPIVKLDDGQIIGFEALARWLHPERGLVAPTEFIPVAEETGLIHELGLSILEKACAQTRRWQEKLPDYTGLSIAVNVSSQQFTHSGFLEQIETALQNSRLPARCLKLEITESLLMHNFEAAKIMLAQLRDRDIQILLDDFGTGYSSLSYLHHFPLNMLKIDRSFVSDFESHSQHQVIVRTIKTLASSLELQVVAEGIESLTQLRALQDLGCEYGQGYFFSRPLAAGDAEQLLIERASGASAVS